MLGINRLLTILVLTMLLLSACQPIQPVASVPASKLDNVTVAKIEGIVQKAHSQLAASPLAIAENRVGLFFAIFVANGDVWPSATASAFTTRVRDAVRAEFTSDHKIRMTALVVPTQIHFGLEPWWTACWLTWGRPK